MKFFQNAWFSSSKPTKVQKAHRRLTCPSPRKEMMLTRRGGRGVFDAKNFTCRNLILPTARIETIVSFFTIKSFAVQWRKDYQRHPTVRKTEAEKGQRLVRGCAAGQWWDLIPGLSNEPQFDASFTFPWTALSSMGTNKAPRGQFPSYQSYSTGKVTSGGVTNHGTWKWEAPTLVTGWVLPLQRQR